MCVMWPAAWLCGAGFFFFFPPPCIVYGERNNGNVVYVTSSWTVTFMTARVSLLFFFLECPYRPHQPGSPLVTALSTEQRKPHFNSVLRKCFRSRACQHTPHKWETSIVCFAPLHFVRVRAAKCNYGPGKKHWSILWSHKGCSYLDLQPGVSSPPGDTRTACLKVYALFCFCFFLSRMLKLIVFAGGCKQNKN